MAEDPRPGTLPSGVSPCTSSPRVGGAAPARSLRRTPVGSSKKLNASFKSPILSSHRSSELSAADLQIELKDLKKKSEDLDQQIAELISEGYTLDELDQHIDQLHEYNDIKDVGQMLLGKLERRPGDRA